MLLVFTCYENIVCDVLREWGHVVTVVGKLELSERTRWTFSLCDWNIEYALWSGKDGRYNDKLWDDMQGALVAAGWPAKKHDPVF